MRNLGLRDVFMASEILDIMDIKLDINALMDGATESEDTFAFAGGQVALLFFRNIYKAEVQVYTWIASLTEKTIGEVKALGIKDFMEIITEVMQKEDITDFFGSLGLIEQTSKTSSSEDTEVLSMSSE